MGLGEHGGSKARCDLGARCELNQMAIVTGGKASQEGNHA